VGLLANVKGAASLDVLREPGNDFGQYFAPTLIGKPQKLANSCCFR